MITFNEAASILRKIVDCPPTLYKEYKDRYRFVFAPDNCGTDLLSWSINVDIYKRTGKVEYPSLFDIVNEKSKPIRKGIYIKYIF